jgi:hypothetical protein
MCIYNLQEDTAYSILIVSVASVLGIYHFTVLKPKATLHEASTEANQVCKLLAMSYLSFLNIHFIKTNGKSSTVQVAKQAGWQGK